MAEAAGGRPPGAVLPGSPAAHLVLIAPTGSGKTVAPGTLLLRWATADDPPVQRRRSTRRGYGSA